MNVSSFRSISCRSIIKCNIIKKYCNSNNSRSSSICSRSFFSLPNSIPSSSSPPSSSSSSSSSSKRHYERRLLKYTNEQLFDVVSNINEYSIFVPWCKESKIISDTTTTSITNNNNDDKINNNNNNNNNNRTILADLVVGFGLFNERYSSNVLLQYPYKITATSTQTSLLEYLKTEWTFTKADDPKSCWVIFQIDFKFKSPLYNHVSDLFMKEVVNNMVHAFETRCEKIYKK